MRSRVVLRAAMVTELLARATPYGVITSLRRSLRKSDGFTDRYVMLHAMAALILSGAVGFPILQQIALLYLPWRIFEIVIVLLNAIMFDDYLAAARGRRPRRFAGIRRLIILTGFNYVEVLASFALFYRHELDNLTPQTVQAWIAALNFSLVTMTGLGHTTSAPEALGTRVVALTMLQVSIGLFLGVAVIARFLLLMPSVGSGDLVERKLSH